jgi:spore coat protein U-like protein
MKTSLGGALVLLACLVVTPARAENCNFTGGWVSFGVVNPASAGNLDTIGELVLDCNGRIRAEISLSVGAGSGASYSGGRRMTQLFGPGSLRYNLYADASRSQVLGDGTGGSVTLQVAGKNDTVIPIYGRIPGPQAGVTSGSYADLIVATVTY